MSTLSASQAVCAECGRALGASREAAPPAVKQGAGRWRALRRRIFEFCKGFGAGGVGVAAALCPPCQAKVRRRRRILDGAKIAVLLVALGAFAFWLSGTSRETPGATRSVALAPVVAGEGDPSTTTSGAVGLATGAPVEAQTAADDAVADRLVLAELAEPRTNPELRTAIQEALESGASRSWQSGKHFGLVVVGGLEASGQQVCRKYWYSVSGPTAEGLSRSGVSCHVGGVTGWTVN